MNLEAFQPLKPLTRVVKEQKVETFESCDPDDWKLDPDLLPYFDEAELFLYRLQKEQKTFDEMFKVDGMLLPNDDEETFFQTNWKGFTECLRRFPFRMFYLGCNAYFIKSTFRPMLKQQRKSFNKEFVDKMIEIGFVSKQETIVQEFDGTEKTKVKYYFNDWAMNQWERRLMVWEFIKTIDDSTVGDDELPNLSLREMTTKHLNSITEDVFNVLCLGLRKHGIIKD